MRIYKPYCKQRDGTKKRTKKWYLDFYTHLGENRKLAGYESKRMTEKLGEYVQELVNCRALGQTPDVKLSVWLDSMPVRIMKKLTECG